MTEYEIQANEFLRMAETKMSISRTGEVHGFPFDPSDNLWHYKYQVVLTRNHKQYRFTFYDSNFNWQNSKRPSRYDVLACLEKYEVPGNVYDFASDFEYPTDSPSDLRFAKKVWKACKEQYERLLDLFGDELMDKLREIN